VIWFTIDLYVEEYHLLGYNAYRLLSRWFLAQLIFSTLKMEAICSSETLVDTLRTPRRYIPGDGTVRNHRCENLKSYTIFVIWRRFFNCISWNNVKESSKIYFKKRSRSLNACKYGGKPRKSHSGYPVPNLKWNPAWDQRSSWRLTFRLRSSGVGSRAVWYIDFQGSEEPADSIFRVR
jgi:hypothetical protein